LFVIPSAAARHAPCSPPFRRNLSIRPHVFALNFFPGFYPLETSAPFLYGRGFHMPADPRSATPFGPFPPIPTAPGFFSLFLCPELVPRTPISFFFPFAVEIRFFAFFVYLFLATLLIHPLVCAATRPSPKARLSTFFPPPMSPSDNTLSPLSPVRQSGTLFYP